MTKLESAVSAVTGGSHGRGGGEGGGVVESVWEGALRGRMTRWEACPSPHPPASSQEFEC